ncbi:MAG: O-antigen ligase family protein [Alphaproteobacteria bacterium]|nr:O-antigen ligase family protein [Alphaproteobacteria bacterium]
MGEVGLSREGRRFADLMPSRADLALDRNDFRAVCLFAACFVYALFGSPTPDRFGWAEILTGGLLALGGGAGRFREVFVSFGRRSFWRGSGQVFLLYGLSVPVIGAAFAGANMVTVLRDMVPFLFLFLPLFYVRLFEDRPGYYRTILFAVLMVGLIFSLRSLVMVDSSLCWFWCTEELLYLENMPTVLFTALFLCGAACARVMRRAGFVDLTWFGLLAALACVPLAAMALTLQRASLGAFVFYMGMVFAYLFYKRPYRALVLLVCGAVAASFVWALFSHIFVTLSDKTALVGLNQRPQEWAAVWDVVTSSPWRFLFGLGWGGEFNSPAVGELRVNFTHNFFSTMLLKAGVCGLFLSLGYILGFAEILGRLLLKNPVLGLALAAPVLIDLTLYASFKSLDFGLVLLMIPASLIYSKHSESTV